MVYIRKSDGCAVPPPVFKLENRKRRRIIGDRFHNYFVVVRLEPQRE